MKVTNDKYCAGAHFVFFRLLDLETDTNENHFGDKAFLDKYCIYYYYYY